jgi:hypothetical protein
VKRGLNRVLIRATGYQLSKPPPPELRPAVVQRARLRSAQRQAPLVESPVFVLSSVRSGSTLLRMILNSHSLICAPHELHLRSLQVTVRHDFAKEAMALLGLDERALENLLWDRVLDWELGASGKRIIVEKTPNMVFAYRRLIEAWPAMKFIVLLRHPAGIADSLFRARDEPNLEEVHKRVISYVNEIQKARRYAEEHNVPTAVVRYEDLVSDPQRVTKELCSFLGVEWEAEMIDYGKHDHGPLVARLGDWQDKIQSGSIQTDIVIPAKDEVPASLVGVSRKWGYL